MGCHIVAMYPKLWICASLIVIAIFHDGDAIYNGARAQLGEFPYIVYIENHSEDCGGIILDEYHILTAAHCVDCLVHERDLLIVAGTVKLPPESTDVVFRFVQTIHRHPDYSPTSKDACLRDFALYFKSILGNLWRELDRTNNIAVLTLTEPLPFGNNIMKVELPSNDFLEPDCNPYWFTGWGSAEECNFIGCKFLKFMQLMPVDNPLENDLVYDHRSNEFSAYSIYSDSHAEEGDSGGALIGGDVVYGICSRGITKSGGRIVFTKVYDHLRFIWKSMSDIKRKL